jgi:hypothetical protein
MGPKKHITVVNRDLGGTTTLQLKCWKCKRETELKVPTKGFDEWAMGTGKHIQYALPQLSPGDREFMISGTCEPCFDAMFGE